MSGNIIHPAENRTDEQPTMITHANGDKFWRLKNGKYHREDGPAVEYANGTKEWYLNGQRHREDGPAIEYAYDGYKAWYLNGQRHRTDGPAYESANGDKCWRLKNGKLHRTDGPALEYASGTKLWYLNGKQMTEDEFENWKFVQWCTTPAEYTG